MNSKHYRILLIFILLITIPTTIASKLECTVTNNCPYEDIFHISSLSNAHAELNTESNYAYKVCCRDSDPSNLDISTSLNSGDMGLLGFSSSTNSHVEKYTLTNYPTDLYLNVNGEVITCGYANSCTSYDTCLVSISRDSNAHVGDCVTNPYTTKLCCSLGTAPTPDFQVWVEREGLYTIGRGESVQIYVKNIGTEKDSYNVEVTDIYAKSGHEIVSHLVMVSILSNKIEFVEPDDVGNTFATLTILGPITEGKVEFTVTSQGDGTSKTASIDLFSGYPIDLPEFSISILVVFATTIYGFFRKPKRT